MDISELISSTVTARNSFTLINVKNNWWIMKNSSNSVPHPRKLKLCGTTQEQNLSLNECQYAWKCTLFKSPYSENNYNVAYGNSLYTKDDKQIKRRKPNHLKNHPCGRPLRTVSWSWVATILNIHHCNFMAHCMIRGLSTLPVCMLYRVLWSVSSKNSTPYGYLRNISAPLITL